MNANFLCPITMSVMADPVIGSDGITYERAAIEESLAKNPISPLTRAPMTAASLRPNYALKALIEEAHAPTTSGVASVGAIPAPIPAPQITVAAHRIGTTDRYHIRLSASGPELPLTVIIGADISGSMGDPSVDPTTGQSDAVAFSRADLVRHSVATTTELLRPDDELAVVLFDNNATVALEPTRLTPAGKAVAKSILPKITPCGGTNIWLGLLRCLEVAEKAATTDPTRNIAIILQTDGESDPAYNPPRGIVPTFRTWLDNHPAIRLTVHTAGYGFGAKLDMPLLRQIAEAGNGTVSYIPDGSMVGTVFIHLLANLATAVVKDVVLQVPEAGIHYRVGFLQSGVSRNIILTAPIPMTVAVSGAEPLTVDPATVPQADPATTDFHVARQELLGTLRAALAAAEAGNDDQAATLLALKERLAALQGTAPLLTDLEDPDRYKGQLSKAFVSRTEFNRWGRHYISGAICEHENEWATNFKDESSKVYGSTATRAMVDRGDMLFNSLPPPTASCAYYRHGGVAASAPTSMSSIHNAAGPCFLPASLVQMANGSQKRCDQVRPGDVLCGDAVIKCVIKTLVPYADVVRVGYAANPDGGYTLWHPVFWRGLWRHPAELKDTVRVQTDAIYNFVLDNSPSGTLYVDGLITCAMGHTMEGPVIGHSYFGKREPGKRNVLDDLAATPGWANGYITWRDVQVEKDANGLICGMTGTAV
jgi:hypothetical protein